MLEWVPSLHFVSHVVQKVGFNPEPIQTNQGPRVPCPHSMNGLGWDAIWTTTRVMVDDPEQLSLVVLTQPLF